MQKKSSNYEPVIVRDLVIGEGIPKVCVPVTGRSEEEIFALAGEIAAAGCADLLEWRADRFEAVQDTEAVTAVLRGLRERLGNMPLLFTFRTERDGGDTPISGKAYEALLLCAVRSGLADLADLELSSDPDTVARVLQAARAAGVKVVMSNHDFAGTPAGEEILRRLLRMQELGADILKIAVMPHSRRDVLTLLAATEEMFTDYARRPLITMSMGAPGMISRVSGEFFGSAVTFGAAGAGLASAPGQIDASDLQTVLRCLHG